MSRFSGHRPQRGATRAAGIVAALALGLGACGGGGEDAGADAGLGAAEVEAVSEPGGAMQEDVVVAADASPPPRVERPPTPSVLAVGPDASVSEMDTEAWVLSPPFYAAGDEPYWRLDILDGWFVFRRAGLPEIEAPMSPPKREDGADVFRSPPLNITVTASSCQTANGESSPYTASVLFDDVTFDGCGFAGTSAGSSAEATAITDSIRAVDSCLARLGDPALVTGVYERGDRKAALGMRTRDGRLFECVTEGGGAVVAFLDQIEPGAAGPWMTSGMRFLRAGQGVNACDDAEAVSDGGEVIGHMLSATCRF